MKKQACGITCVISILLIVAAWKWNSDLKLDYLTTQEECSTHNVPGECGIWDGQRCFAGYVDNGVCVKKSQVGPYTLGILGVLLLLSSLGYLGYLSQGQSVRTRHTSGQKFGFKFY